MGVGHMKRLVICSIILGIAQWSNGLQPGLEYYYHYTGSIETGIPEIDSQVSKVKIECDISVEVHGYQYFNVKLSNIKSGYLHGDGSKCVENIEMKESMKELELPFTVNFADIGGVVMKVPESDTIWVTNMRKGIVSLLQAKPVLDAKYYGVSSSFSAFEQTLHGYCESRYYLQPLPQFQANLQDHHIEIDAQEVTSHSAAIKASSSKKRLQGKKTRGRGGSKSFRSSKSKGPSKSNYRDSNVPKISNNLWNLDRVINFDNCRKRITLQDVTMGINKKIGKGQTDNLSSRRSVSHYLLRGDSNGFRVEHAHQEGGLSVNPTGVTTEKIITTTNQSITLVSVKSSLNSIEPSTPMREVTTFYYEVMSPFAQSPDVHEDWIHYLNQDAKTATVYPELILLGKQYTPDEQAKIKDDIIVFLKKAAHILLNEPDGKDSKEVINLLQIASFNTFYLPQSLIADLFDEAYADDTSLMETLITDVIAGGGSGAAVRVLLEKFDQGKISSWRMMSVFVTLTNSLFDVTVIKDLKDFVTKRELSKSPIVNSNFLINFATMAKKLCLSSKAEEQVGGPIFGIQNCDPTMITTDFVEYLKKNIESTSHTWEKSVSVQALVNLGSPYTLSILEEIILSPHPVVIKLNAIKGFHHDHLPGSARETAMKFLNEVFHNVSEISEVREEALQGLISWKPDSAWWHLLASNTWHEPSRSVRNYIYSTIKSIAETQEVYCEKQKKIATHVLPLTRPGLPGFRFSFNKYSNRYIRNINHLKQLAKTFFSSLESSLPRHLSASFKSNRGGIEFLKLFGIEATLEGFQGIIKMTRGIWGHKDAEVTDPKDIGAKIALGLYDKVIEQLYDGSQPYRTRSQDAMEAHILFEVYDNMQFILPLTPHSIYSDNDLDLTTLILELSFGKEFLFNKYSPLMFLAYAMPSDIGLPIVTEHASLFSFHDKALYTMSMNSNMNDMLSGSPSVNFNIEDDTRVQYLYNTRVGTYAPWDSKTLSTVVVNSYQLVVPGLYEIGIQKDEDGTLRSTSSLSRLYDSDLQFFSMSTVPLTMKASLPFTSNNVEQIGSSLPIAGVLKGVTRCGGDKLTGLHICAEMTSDPIYSDILPMRKRPATVRFRDLHLTRYAKKSPTTKFVLVSTLYKGNTGKQESESTKQYSQYSQYDQYDQVSSNDYSYSERFDDTVGSSAQASQTYQITDSSQDRLAKIQQSDFDGTQLSYKLIFEGGSSPISYEFITASKHQKLHKYFEFKSQNMLMSSLLGDKNICLDTYRHSMYVSSMDKLEELVDNPVTSSFEATLGQCSESPNVKLEIVGKMTSDRLKALYEEITGNDCDYDKYNEIGSFVQLATYDEGKVTLQVMDISQSLLDEANAVIGGPHGVLLKECLDMSTKTSRTIQIQALSPPPYDKWDLELFYEGVSQRKEAALISNFPMVAIYNPIKYMKYKYYDDCVVENDHVRQFDGLEQYYTPNPCWIVAAQDCSREDGWIVMTREASPSEPVHVRIISPTDSLVVDMVQGEVKANGKIVNPIGEKEMIASRSGKTLGMVRRKDDIMQVIILGELRVTMKNRVEISVTHMLKNRLCGMCGNMDSEINFPDFVGPKRCLYNDFNKLAVAWSSESDDCDLWGLLDRKTDVTDYQNTCEKVPPSTYMPAPQQHGEIELKTANMSSVDWVYPVVKYNPSGDGSNDVCIGYEPVPVETMTQHYPYFSYEFKQRTYRCWPPSDLPSDIKQGEDLGYVNHPWTAHTGREEVLWTRVY